MYLFLVFLDDAFEIQCRVQNKPYDVFGCWFDDAHLLSGNLFWVENLDSTSHIFLNKVNFDMLWFYWLKEYLVFGECGVRGKGIVQTESLSIIKINSLL